MIKIKSPGEIKTLKEGGKILAEILAKIAEQVLPGITTQDLDRLARELIKKEQARPSFLGYHGYPAALCTSVNEQVVHGIPGERMLEEGDLLSLDLGIEYRGLYTDCAVTLGVGHLRAEDEHLRRATALALDWAIREMQPGVCWGDVAAKIQQLAESKGLAVIRDLVGHGVGFAVHEEPALPNFGKPGTGEILQEGMVLAVEPMFVLGDWKVETLSDGWTVVTADKKRAAHFEHTLAVTASGTQILTTAV